jgi:hypothetical protein
MKKTLLFLVLFLAVAPAARAQVVYGFAPGASAKYVSPEAGGFITPAGEPFFYSESIAYVRSGTTKPASCTNPRILFHLTVTDGANPPGVYRCNGSAYVTGFSGGSFTSPMLGADGTASAPTYSFSSDANLGWYRIATNGRLGFGSGGNTTPGVMFGGASYRLAGNWAIEWSTTNNDANQNTDAAIAKDAANALSFRNSTNAQRVNIANTFTSTSNREDLSLYFTSNVGHIGTTTTGATARALQIDYGGTSTAAMSVPITSGPVTFGGGVNLGGTTLSTYTEGSWTPAVAFGGAATGITYTTQVGRYTQVGDLVYAQCRVVLSSKGSSTGAMSITGLPVAASSTANQYAVGSAFATSMTYTGTLQVYVDPTATTSIQVGVNNGGTNASIADTNATNTTIIMVTIVYRTN